MPEPGGLAQMKPPGCGGGVPVGFGVVVGSGDALGWAVGVLATAGGGRRGAKTATNPALTSTAASTAATAGSGRRLRGAPGAAPTGTPPALGGAGPPPGMGVRSFKRAVG